MVFGFLKTKAHSTRHYVIVMAFAVVLIASGIFGSSYATKYVYDANSGSIIETNQVTSSFSRSNPVRLQIPALNVDTSFVLPLGLAPDQTVSVPESYDQVGWYEGGATPGEIGPAVILGHVDSVAGPAIFYSLGQLRRDDEILVTRADGTTATFVVTKSRRYEQVNFPTDTVYGPTSDAELRLVTCSGLFNKGEQRYSHNLVVFAKLKE